MAGLAVSTADFELLTLLGLGLTAEGMEAIPDELVDEIIWSPLACWTLASTLKNSLYLVSTLLVQWAIWFA